MYQAWPCGQPALGSRAWHAGPRLAGRPPQNRWPQPPPFANLLYPLPLPGCSLKELRAQPIRREHSQKALANRWPAFAGTAKPLGEKQ